MSRDTVDDDAYDDLVGPRTPRAPDEKEVRAEAWAATFKRLAWVALIAMFASVLGVGVWTVVEIRHTQVGNKTTLQQAKNAAVSSKRTADRIEDCTTPGGDCFERGQASTSGAIAGINTVTVRATACLAVILKQFPAGTVVNVDSVAKQIQRCIQNSSVTVPPAKAPTGVTSSGTTLGKSSTRPKGPRRTSPATPTPAAPSPSVRPSPTPCQALTLLCDLKIPLPTLLP